jgi:predicted 3-demethylubiquinone-9 3-methyltransferase (glyoxalase superfamily)
MKNDITPCFWFDGNAKEAVEFYVSLFDASRVVSTNYYGEGGPMPAGTVLTVAFELRGRPFLALNGGPQYQFSPAVSMTAYCDTQEEIDTLWDQLCEGGQPQQCGWVSDRFGLTWQVVPSILPELMARDAATANRVMQAFLPMVKLDIETIKRAAQHELDAPARK